MATTEEDIQALRLAPPPPGPPIHRFKWSWWRLLEVGFFIVVSIVCLDAAISHSFCLNQVQQWDPEAREYVVCFSHMLANYPAILTGHRPPPFVLEAYESNWDATRPRHHQWILQGMNSIARWLNSNQTLGAFGTLLQLYWNLFFLIGMLLCIYYAFIDFLNFGPLLVIMLVLLGHILFFICLCPEPIPTLLLYRR